MGGGTREVVDLSHTITNGMITYPGLPGPVIDDHLSRAESRGRYAPGTEFQIGRITLVANTGTYADVPFHRFGDGADLAEVPLSRFVDVAGIAVAANDSGPIGPAAFAGLDVAGRAVLIHTSWDRHWGTPRYAGADHPFVSAACADWLAAREPAVVGIDSVNIDDMADFARPAHTALLGRGIPIVEHMTGLGRLLHRRFRFHAAPVAVAGMGTFPVRAYALIEE